MFCERGADGRSCLGRFWILVQLELGGSVLKGVGGFLLVWYGSVCSVCGLSWSFGSLGCQVGSIPSSWTTLSLLGCGVSNMTSISPFMRAFRLQKEHSGIRNEYPPRSTSLIPNPCHFQCTGRVSLRLAHAPISKSTPCGSTLDCRSKCRQTIM